MNILKRMASMAMAVVMLASVICFANVAQVSAAEVIPVYLNGKLMEFPSNDAQPQIYQNRTYVPIRKTAEYLGLSIQWNAKTETLTFSREGLTIDHTMRSNIVYVSGQPLTFDTRSINVQNRTLMPIRMLGESIGAKVDWDSEKRAVYITTADAVNTETTEATTVAPVSGKAPQLLTAEASKSLVSIGEKVKISVTAKDATRVKLTDAATGKEIETITEYGESADGTRVFEALIIASNDTKDAVIKSITVAAGDDAKFYEEAQNIKTVNYGVTTNKSSSDKDDDDDDDDDDEKEDIKSDYLVSYKLDKTSYEEDDYAVVTVVTTDEVSKVRITNSFSSGRAESSEYTENGSKRTFKVKTRLSKKGNVYLYITLYIEDEGYEAVNQKVSIKVGGTSSSRRTSDGIEIIDVELLNDTVYKGEDAKLLVTTSDDVTEVSVFDSDDKKVASSFYYYGKDDDELTWSLDFKVNHTDREKYTIYAYNDDDEKDSETLKIEAEDYSKNDAIVLNVDQRTSNVKEGDECKFTVKCTTGIDYVVLADHKGGEITTARTGSKSGSYRTFTLKGEIDDLDEDYYIYGYDDKDYKESTYKFRVKGRATEDIEILSVDVEDSRVDIDDDIELVVETTTNVEKLTIVDQDDNRVYKKSKPTEEKSSKYIWEISFQAEEKGKNTFTITVEDDDDNTDEWDFNVTVDK